MLEALGSIWQSKRSWPRYFVIRELNNFLAKPSEIFAAARSPTTPYHTVVGYRAMQLAGSTKET